MFKRILALILCGFLLIASNLNILAHDAFLNVVYDSCDAEKLANGINEVWYEVDDIFYPDKSVHLSHETYEIRFYFSDQSEWIDSVQQVAFDNWQVVLTNDEATDMVEQIQSVLVESMQKWNNVYYYSYDAYGNKTAHKIITVTEGDFSNHNLIIEPAITTEFVARTIFSRASWEYIYIQDYHHHSSFYTMQLSINDAYESVYQISPETEAELAILRENTGAHEIGHILGLGDLDTLCESACDCNECNDGDNEVCKGHHEETLMGYGQTESRVTHITYKDIAGVSITRGFHTDSNHVWMLRINTENNTKDVICALCNGVKLSIQNDVQFNGGVYYYLGEEIPVFGSCNNAHDVNNSNMLLVATDLTRDFYKCLCCRYIAEVPHSVHLYTEWSKHNATHHIESCKCGQIGTATSLHVVRLSEVVNNIGFCVECGARVMLGDDFVQVGPASITKVTVNGSYILPNGIIVLVDEDIEAYENGTLVWYDKDKLPQTQ